MSWASLISGIVSLFNRIAGLLHDQRQQELGAKEAILEGKENVDKVANDIAIAQRDDGVRNDTRRKYSRKGNTLQ